MSFWMELRCDARHNGCLSHQNQGPMVLVSNVIAGCKILAKDAEQQGWQYHGKEMLCPNCKARRDASAA